MGSASSTRAVISPGSTATNVIDYVTIATTGNATDFGDLTVSRYAGAACGSPTRALFQTGYNGSWPNVIDYVTIATTGNATDFGDVTEGRSSPGACSTHTIGILGGGENNTGLKNIIDYVTIATTGNATDFGDLLQANTTLAGTSNGHGGL
jgi:hypothetical protein